MPPHGPRPTSTSRPSSPHRSPLPPVPPVRTATGARRRPTTSPATPRVDKGPSPRRLDLLPTYLHPLLDSPRPLRLLLSPRSASATRARRARCRPHRTTVATVDLEPHRRAQALHLPRLRLPGQAAGHRTPPRRLPRHRLPPRPGRLRRQFTLASSPPSPLCSPAGHGEPLPSSPRPSRRRPYLVVAIPAVAEPSAADACRLPLPGDQMATRSSPSPSHAHGEVPWPFSLSANELPLLTRIEPSSGRRYRRRCALLRSTPAPATTAVECARSTAAERA